MSSATGRIPRGAYAERLEPTQSKLDHALHRGVGLIARRLGQLSAERVRLPKRVEVWQLRFSALTDAHLRSEAGALAAELRSQGFRPELVARGFALVREAAVRTVGQRHYDVQLMGGLVLLRGAVAEMETGEGKTLTATLPGCIAALAGLPVHVITVNDYLAARDAEAMGPVYRALGLSVGVIQQGMDPETRRAAYGCDVAYVTNKELCFDYLKDRIALGSASGRIQLALDRLGGAPPRTQRLVLRGLHFGLVDEADSVLVDEARTPLIISGEANQEEEQDAYELALDVAAKLEHGRDFEIRERSKEVRLTTAGQERIEQQTPRHGGALGGQLQREALVRQALTALHVFKRERDYLVRDGKVQIIDEYTGRLMPDRAWEHGLHQLVEVKEDCEPTHRRAPLARISYQRFFRRYMRLSGMTGTAAAIAGELWDVYGLRVVRIPTNRPIARRGLGDRIFADADGRWRAVVDRVREVHATGRPILVGTRSVDASERLAKRLDAAGLPHRVLNARQDGEEAAIIAEAGGPGQVTIATNMAGRGTDIVLGPGVAQAGGLHVIATERHEAGRIDRQLFGRCGRQGDPGSFEAFSSLEDELVALHAPRPLIRVARAALASGGPWGSRTAHPVVRVAQRRAEQLHARMRSQLLAHDEGLERMLAFSGRGE